MDHTPWGMPVKYIPDMLTLRSLRNEKLILQFVLLAASPAAGVPLKGGDLVLLCSQPLVTLGTSILRLPACMAAMLLPDDDDGACSMVSVLPEDHPTMCYCSALLQAGGQVC